MFSDRIQHNDNFCEIWIMILSYIYNWMNFYQSTSTIRLVTLTVLKLKKFWSSFIHLIIDLSDIFCSSIMYSSNDFRQNHQKLLDYADLKDLMKSKVMFC